MFSYMILTLHKIITLWTMKTLNPEVQKRYTYENKTKQAVFHHSARSINTIPIGINNLAIIITKNFHIIYLTNTECYFSILQIRKQRLKKCFFNVKAISIVYFLIPDIQITFSILLTLQLFVYFNFLFTTTFCLLFVYHGFDCEIHTPTCM